MMTVLHADHPGALSSKHIRTTSPDAGKPTVVQHQWAWRCSEGVVKMGGFLRLLPGAHMHARVPGTLKCL